MTTERSARWLLVGELVRWRDAARGMPLAPRRPRRASACRGRTRPSRDVAALLRAQQVAGAADLEVAQRHLEAGAQLARLEDRRESLLRYLVEHAVLRVRQVGVGLVGGAADAASELVHLREAEAVGAVDDHRVDVRDVDAGLDDRRTDQHVEFAVAELRHHLFEQRFRHLAVAHDDLSRRRIPVWW